MGIQHAPNWLNKLDSIRDPELAKWFISYCEKRVPQSGVPISKSGVQLYDLKQRVMNIYRSKSEIDYRFIRVLNEAYRQFENRRNKSGSIQRTYKLSREAIDKLDFLSKDSDISKNQLIETLIKEASNVRELLDSKKSRGKQLTVKDIQNPYAREHGVGDFIFGSKAFPDERSLGKKVETIVRKLNKQANANKGCVNPLRIEEVIRLFELEGVIHNVYRSLSQQSAPGFYGRPLSTDEVSRSIDDLRIEDVFELRESTRIRLRQRREVYCNRLSESSGGTLLESQIIERMLEEALEGVDLRIKANSFMEENSRLKSKIADLERLLKAKLDSLDYTDERIKAINSCVEVITNRLIDFYDRQLKESNALAKYKEEGYGRGLSTYRARERDEALKQFRLLMKQVVTGKVSPDAIRRFEFPFID